MFPSTKVFWQVEVIISISVMIAMYFLLQFYLCVSAELAPRQPLLKLISIKAVGGFASPNLNRLSLTDHTPSWQYF
jgi:hypothetical protein